MVLGEMMNKKHYIIRIECDDPYPKVWESKPVEARTHGRAIDFATRTWKKTRPNKREIKVLRIRSERLG